MSYSRWSNSVWYTFWCSTDSEEMDEQLFDVCGICSFTYAELKQGLDKCIDKIKGIIAEDNQSEPITFTSDKYTEDEYDELKIYMKRFIKDIEEEYPL